MSAWNKGALDSIPARVLRIGSTIDVQLKIERLVWYKIKKYIITIYYSMETQSLFILF